MVTMTLDNQGPVDLDKVKIELPASESAPIDPASGFDAPAPEPDADKEKPEDPNEAILRSLRENKK